MAGTSMRGMPDDVEDRRRFYPRGWAVALVLLALALAWLFVGVFWAPGWWPAWLGSPLAR